MLNTHLYVRSARNRQPCLKRSQAGQPPLSCLPVCHVLDRLGKQQPMVQATGCPFRGQGPPAHRLTPLIFVHQKSLSFLSFFEALLPPLHP
mmetsp:Transcript_56014/g.131083  ORF Transcript_56014/g.131083 Transcript_56014/m.131083 type:complete len:91 (-) Transcript_56014:1241-1513(-)